MNHTQQLIDFANAVMKDWPEGGNLDGGDIQDLAEKYGLLIPKDVTEPCGEDCMCSEFYSLEEFQAGLVKCFRKAPFLIDPILPYASPELTDENKKKANEDANKLIKKHGYNNLPKMLAYLCIENVRLVKEINEHRAARSID